MSQSPVAAFDTHALWGIAVGMGGVVLAVVVGDDASERPERLSVKGKRPWER